MHTHDEMVKLCTEMVLGMTHKLNEVARKIIAIIGINLICYLSELSIYRKCTVLKYEFYMHENDIIR